MKAKLNVWALALGLLPWATGGAWAGTIYVNADAPGAHTGQSWTSAYTDLQTALAAAQWGDEIWVAAGAYKPTSGTDANKSFVMPAGVALYGGFAGAETTREARDWQAHQTILSGDIGQPGVASDNSAHVVAGGYNATLDGFTITGGNGANGGGLVNDSVSLTIANCIFSDNAGGAMVNTNASPTVTHCTFRDNAGAYGGGMYNYNGSSPTVTHCTFTSNTASNSGGGMYNYNGSSPTVDSCTFAGNTAVNGRGGGMNNTNASPVVTNCVFTGNVAAKGDGGAMLNDYGASPTVINCTFTGNVAANSGGAMYNYGSSVAPKMTNCILWGNGATFGPEAYNSSATPTFSHCDIQGSGGSGSHWNRALGIDGGGNLMAAPVFRDELLPAGSDGLWLTGDDGLALQVGSPCIDTGANSDAPTTDTLGYPRLVDGNGDGQDVCDIGAYEFLPAGPTAPEGGLVLTFQIRTPSLSPDGQPVRYTYVWTSNQDETVTHGPTPATSDSLVEMDLVQPGETWTVTVTPTCGGLPGTPTVARVQIHNPHNGVVVWELYP